MAHAYASFGEPDADTEERLPLIPRTPPSDVAGAGLRRRASARLPDAVAGDRARQPVSGSASAPAPPSLKVNVETDEADDTYGFVMVLDKEVDDRPHSPAAADAIELALPADDRNMGDGRPAAVAAAAPVVISDRQPHRDASRGSHATDSKLAELETVFSKASISHGTTSQTDWAKDVDAKNAASNDAASKASGFGAAGGGGVRYGEMDGVPESLTDTLLEGTREVPSHRLRQRAAVLECAVHHSRELQRLFDPRLPTASHVSGPLRRSHLRAQLCAQFGVLVPAMAQFRALSAARPGRLADHMRRIVQLVSSCVWKGESRHPPSGAMTAWEGVNLHLNIAHEPASEAAPAPSAALLAPSAALLVRTSADALPCPPAGFLETCVPAGPLLAGGVVVATYIPAGDFPAAGGVATSATGALTHSVNGPALVQAARLAVVLPTQLAANGSTPMALAGDSGKRKEKSESERHQTSKPTSHPTLTGTVSGDGVSLWDSRTLPFSLTSGSFEAQCLPECTLTIRVTKQHLDPRYTPVSYVMTLVSESGVHTWASIKTVQDLRGAALVSSDPPMTLRPQIPRLGPLAVGPVDLPVCVVCSERRTGAVCDPCGHAAACLWCASHLRAGCPICGKAITKVVPFYLV
jgi:hypothetical protein